MNWAREQQLTADDEVEYLREFDHITLARLRIAQYQQGEHDAIHEALRLLQRLLQAAEAGYRHGSALEILILLALAHKVNSDTPQARAKLERALELAQSEGYIQLFISEGQPMQRLLDDVSQQGVMPVYTRKLLNAFEASPDDVMSPANQQLIEPLSERELEILQLVADGLSNREISDRLYLALSTVKGHNRNIYGKLGVKRRTEAVALARELGLLTET